MIYTLHYRIGLDDGTEVLSTFGGTPATLAAGQGELAPGLERCLAQAEAGKRTVFLLEPEQAFGAHRPELVQRLPGDARYEPGLIMEFAAGDGSTHAGLVREVDDHGAIVDFNHPLAGKRIRFEVEVLALT